MTLACLQGRVYAKAGFPLGSRGSASTEGKGKWHPRGGALLDARPGGTELG